MPLKVVLFDFNGVIVDDEPIHAQLIREVIASENMRCSEEEAQRFVGRSDRACLQDYFTQKGRVVTPDTLNKLLAQKTAAYQQHLQALEQLPLFSGVKALISSFQSHNLKLGIVSGAQRGEVNLVLRKARLETAFEIIVADEDTTASKPSPEGYQQAVNQFRDRYPELNVRPGDCLAIEDSFAGLEAARSAQIPVVGVAHTYPFHMLQRRARWAIDALSELEVDRLIQVYAGGNERDWEKLREHSIETSDAIETNSASSTRSAVSDPALPHE